MKLRVGRLLERSRANGPGERFVVWARGCSLGCPGCFNPELWAAHGGEWIETADLAARVAAVEGLRGVTLSGGEPLEQPEAVAEFLSRLDPRFDVVLFSGFTRAGIAGDPAKEAAIARVDLLVAGRYMRELASDDDPWTGSLNKEVHALTGRIRPDEPPEARVEVTIGPDGSALLTGFPDAPLRARLRSL